MEQTRFNQKKDDESKFWGSLWLNKEKKNPKAPDLTGEAEIENQKFKLAIWKNLDRTNNKPDYKLCLSKAQEKQIEQELN
ncbi:MAG TPA: hypothetical protein P5277_02575 [Candidatus Paceibacterota bacterium]|nr:hypothetical protein [Candidatus Paceibacterota bacterium]